jgi:hypothetical protein
MPEEHSCNCSGLHVPECTNSINSNDACPVCREHPGRGHPCGWVMPTGANPPLYRCERESPTGQTNCGGSVHDTTCDAGRGGNHCLREACATVLCFGNEYGQRMQRTCKHHAIRWAIRRYNFFRDFVKDGGEWADMQPEDWISWD